MRRSIVGKISSSRQDRISPTSGSKAEITSLLCLEAAAKMQHWSVAFEGHAFGCGGAGRVQAPKVHSAQVLIFHKDAMREVMKEDVQEAFKKALAGFEKRLQAELQRLREREEFETEWIRVKTDVLVPALEEVRTLLSTAGWQCEVRADRDQGLHFTIYRGNGKGERPFMTLQPDKTKDTIAIHTATRGSSSEVGRFTLDQLSHDFIQTEASKFFERLASEYSTSVARDFSSR